MEWFAENIQNIARVAVIADWEKKMKRMAATKKQRIVNWKKTTVIKRQWQGLDWSASENPFTTLLHVPTHNLPMS